MGPKKNFTNKSTFKSCPTQKLEEENDASPLCQNSSSNADFWVVLVMTIGTSSLVEQVAIFGINLIYLAIL